MKNVMLKILTLVVLTQLSFTVTSTTANAVLMEGVTQLGWWPYANAHSLVISDNNLYCSSGNALLVVDITDPASPEKLGELIGAGDSWSGGPNDGRIYAVNGDYLYVAQHYEGLVIVNVSNPNNPSLVTRFDPDSLNINSVAAQEDYVYLATDEGLKVLDVSEPTGPFEIGSLNCGYGGVIVSGDYAYYNNGYTVWIIDISTPGAPDSVGSYTASLPVYDLALDTVNNRLFGACYGRVDIIDVNSPSSPSFLGYYSWGSNSYSTIAIWDHYLAVSCHDFGIEFVDVFEPSSPVQLSQYIYAGGYPRNPIISGDNLYLSIHYRGIEVINIENPAFPSQVAVYHSTLGIPPGSESIPFYGRSFKVATSGNTACVIDDKGLLTFDVTNPYQPELESYLDLDGRGWGMDMVDNIVYCAMTWAGFNIVDVTDPGNPDLLTRLNLDYYVDAVTVQDDYAYIATSGGGDTGIKVFDVSNPSSIIEEGAFYFSPESYELDAQGDYLYVAGRSAGLRILNISDPGNIFQVGQYQDPSSMTSGVDAVGDYAYISESGSGGFKVINVSEPSTPFLEGTCTTPYHYDYSSKQVEVSGNLAYVADYYGGLRVIDVTEPSDPFEVGYYDREDFQENFGVAVADSLIFLAQHAGGLEILMGMPTIPPTGPYVLFNSLEINDETGNNNGMLDFGEDVLLSITVENAGVDTAYHVDVTIVTNDGYTNILDNNEFYGQIAPNSTAVVPNGFEIEVGADVPDMHVIPFTLTATDGDSVWISYFVITAHAPAVEFESLLIEDLTGNNNNQLDPGETADFLVTMKNNGSCDASNIEVTLSTDEMLITIPTATVTIGELLIGAEATITYVGISADPTIPIGTYVDFVLDITADGGYVNEEGFTIAVGDERYQPSGPDAYGYWAYDMYDGSGSPSFDWIEIAPMAGGPGVNLNLGDEEVAHINLPFSFYYYGQEYSEVSICSNGFMNLGYSTVTSYTNQGIPSSGEPNNMVAAFWDDLNPSAGGQVCWYYNATNHRFIVEWYQVPFYPNVGQYTFQIILFDPAFWLTTTGDGDIQVNYSSFSDSSSCTLGIENSNGNTGLQFLYNGTYDQRAMPLEPSFAIKYTTGVTIPELEVTLEPLNPPIIIPATGGTFEYNVTLENIGTSYASFSAWIDVVLPDSTQTGPLLLRTGLTLAPGSTISRDLTQTVPSFAPAGTYTYWGHVGGYPMSVISEDGFEFEKEAGEFSGINPYDDWSISGWDEEDAAAISAIPTDFSLSQNYPNPFNPVTTINFGLPEASKVKLNIYDITGRLVITLVDGWRDAGKYEVTFDGSRFASGVYIYRIDAGEFHARGKMVLLK